MDLAKIGKFISKRRKQQKLTQFELAEKLDITDRAVSKWENGNCLPDSNIMPKLCKILGVTINDLFSGEIVDMKSNQKKLEENLLEMTRQKEEGDRKLLRLEIVMGILCLIPLIAAITIVNLADQMENWLQVALVLTGVAPLILATPFAIAIEQKAGYYECGKCHHKYIPTYAQVFFAQHLHRTRFMKCPKCQQRSWHKKVISK